MFRTNEFRGQSRLNCFARLEPQCSAFMVDDFRQLTAERVVTRFERGRPIRSWQPKRDGERNEALDTFVYAPAALHGLISIGLRLNEEVASVPTRPGVESGRVILLAWMKWVQRSNE